MTNLDDRHLLSYVRCKGTVRMLVVSNFYDDETAFDLDKLFEETRIDFRKCAFESVLISNYSDLAKVGEIIRIRPYESFALYVEDKHPSC